MMKRKHFAPTMLAVFFLWKFAGIAFKKKKANMFILSLHLFVPSGQTEWFVPSQKHRHLARTEFQKCFLFPLKTPSYGGLMIWELFFQFFHSVSMMATVLLRRLALPMHMKWHLFSFFYDFFLKSQVRVVGSLSILNWATQCNLLYTAVFRVENGFHSILFGK